MRLGPPQPAFGDGTEAQAYLATHGPGHVDRINGQHHRPDQAARDRVAMDRIRAVLAEWDRATELDIPYDTERG